MSSVAVTRSWAPVWGSHVPRCSLEGAPDLEPIAAKLHVSSKNNHVL